MSDKIRGLLQQNFGGEKKHGHATGEYIYNCPFCKHYKPKLSVNVIPNQYKQNLWYCWVCHKKGRTLASLFKMAGKYNALQSLQLLGLNVSYHSNDVSSNTPTTINSEVTIKIPIGFYKFDDIPDKKTDRFYSFVNAIDYLTNSRRIPIVDLVRYDIRYTGVRNDKFSNTFIIPSYDADGKLNYLACRKYIDSVHTHIPLSITKNNIGFEQYINWDDTYVILVESALDAITLRYNTIPTWGVNISKKLLNKLLRSSTIKHIYLMFDADVNERHYVKRNLIRKFTLAGKKIHWVVPPNNQDPNELGYLRSWQLIRESKPLKLTDIYNLNIKT